MTRPELDAGELERDAKTARRYLVAQCRRYPRAFGRSAAHTVAERRRVQTRQPFIAWACPVCHGYHVRMVPDIEELERIGRAMRRLDPYKDPAPHQ